MTPARHTQGWQIRCTKCGKTRDVGEAGIVRIGGMDGNPSGQTEGWVVILKMSPHEKGTP